MIPGLFEDRTRGSVNTLKVSISVWSVQNAHYQFTLPLSSLGLSYFLCLFGSPITFSGFSNSHIKAPLPFK